MTKASEREAADVLVIKRVFGASRELVWEAFMRREHLINWWGPKDFTTPILEIDERVGGAWRAVMRGPDGKDYPQHGVVTELVPPERLAFTFNWDEDPGNEMLVSFTFADRGDTTEMTFRQEGFRTRDDRDGHRDGWNESFDRLEKLLARR